MSYLRDKLHKKYLITDMLLIGLYVKKTIVCSNDNIVGINGGYEDEEGGSEHKPNFSNTQKVIPLLT